VKAITWDVHASAITLTAISDRYFCGQNMAFGQNPVSVLMIDEALSQSIIAAVEKLHQDITTHCGGVTSGVQSPVTFAKAVAFLSHVDRVIPGHGILIIASIRQLASTGTDSTMQDQPCKTQENHRSASPCEQHPHESGERQMATA
jgi:hypothetical protein